MPLPRLQLFEFNDSPWAPPVLRDTIVEALSRSLKWGRLLDGLVEPFSDFLRACGTSEVLDLCAGAGGPAAVFSEALARRGVPAHFLLTDLFPQVRHWEALRRERPGQIDFAPEPVDATSIPPSLGAGRARAIINALHHFPPTLARQVLRGACENAPGVFVAEGLIRNPLRFAAFAPFGIPALLASPVLADDRRLARAVLAWTPIGLAVSAWDGTISALRAYQPEDLREMVADLPGWRWTEGTFRYGGVGQGIWFSGVRT
ncbi:MAG: class I SAM-dependent methyltransferase [Myxococcota bacterium]